MPNDAPAEKARSAENRDYRGAHAVASETVLAVVGLVGISGGLVGGTSMGSGPGPARVTAAELPAVCHAEESRVVSECAPALDWDWPASAADCWDRLAGSCSAS
jgi:hypothetical protein